MVALTKPKANYSAPDHILGLIQSFVQGALQRNIIQLVSTGNPQADSLASELQIANALRGFALGHPLFTQGGLLFEMAPTKGCWYDFLVRSADDTVWLPVNIKVSSFRGQDDLSSKAGLFYALTGNRPTGNLVSNWERFCQTLAAQVKWIDCPADYYFLVVEKTPPDSRPGRVFWTSLLQLQTVKANGNRPPFQCNWSENMKRATRSRWQAAENLLRVLEDTLALRAQAHDSFQTHVGPVLNARRTTPHCANRT